MNKVISTDPETMETSPKTVLETYIKEVTTLVHLNVNGEEINCSDYFLTTRSL
ncbi:polymorphic toxin-type HINT domain-containing protein [Ruminococcus bicirculans (ex Wegman et al. 2014)]|uniref:polymorphic toxin-type HINT domain-containing protein n=1 Tax=Ruminococcus bicirculans (ex Wegman et al. 2014) TaxID=1160721 RepID=UPI003461C087